VTIDIDLLNYGDNHISFYLTAEDTSLAGYAAADSSGLTNMALDQDGTYSEGPYNNSSNNLFVHTVDKQNSNNRYELITGKGDVLVDNSPILPEARTICSADNKYCEYIADEDIWSRTFELSVADGYSFDNWSVSNYKHRSLLYNPITEDGSNSTFSFYSEDFQQLILTSSHLNLSPVYRFWSDRYKHHFYTISESEKNYVINNLAHDWTYEGTVFYAAQYTGSCPINTSPLYRFWSDNYKGHFYTASESEKDYVVNNLGHDWSYETVAYCISKEGSGYLYSDIHRFWSDNYKGHFYTVSESEKDYVINNLSHDWDYEGSVFFVSETN
jgi:hypothetical protein